MAISFLNPRNNTLLGVDVLEIHGISDTKEFVITGGLADISADGLEISKDGENWATQITIQAGMGSPFFVRPGVASEGTISATEAVDVP